ncbi:MAG TPA: nucleotidyltransferase [bacterium]|nr:nucleotidyltransferase [bacterium]
MKSDIAYALEKLKDAVERLKEGVAAAGSGLEKDGVIQRFEFSFELMWKAGKLILEDKGIIAANPKDVLKGMFRQGWLKNENGALDMLEDRNKMAHVYSRKAAEVIYVRIKESHADYIEQAYKSLNSAVKEDK